MRQALAARLGQKSVYFARFERFGWRRFMGQYVGKTILLKDIKDATGTVLTDHVWFRVTKGFAKVSLKNGDEVCFEARVGTYARGGRDSDDYDYKLEFPKRIWKVAEQARLDSPSKV